MPANSQAQLRLMRAACAGKTNKVPQKTGCEYVKATKSPKSLPQRKGK